MREYPWRALSFNMSQRVSLCPQDKIINKILINESSFCNLLSSDHKNRERYIACFDHLQISRAVLTNEMVCFIYFNWQDEDIKLENICLLLELRFNIPVARKDRRPVYIQPNHLPYVPDSEELKEPDDVCGDIILKFCFAMVHREMRDMAEIFIPDPIVLNFNENMNRLEEEAKQEHLTKLRIGVMSLKFVSKYWYDKLNHITDVSFPYFLFKITNNLSDCTNIPLQGHKHVRYESLQYLTL